MQDPRLVARTIILLCVAILLLLVWLVLEKRTHKAIADLIFVAIGVVLLSDIFLDPAKGAPHPDSPVLNSGFEIKGPFFGCACDSGITLLLSWLVSRYVGPENVEPTAALPAEENSLLGAGVLNRATSGPAMEDVENRSASKRRTARPAIASATKQRRRSQVLRAISRYRCH